MSKRRLAGMTCQTWTLSLPFEAWLSEVSRRHLTRLDRDLLGERQLR
jgi:hypothetical protein